MITRNHGLSERLLHSRRLLANVIHVYKSINRRFRGVSPACPPPVTGRSASFRLRFRFVRVVRAGEAKLRGRMTIGVLIAGPPGCEYPGACARFFA